MAGADERELRRIHEDWFDRTPAKDLDGLMAHIAEDVVSYEHDQPLQHVGLPAVREVCRTGLEAAGASTPVWTVPDLTILTEGDLAVAWGLNRMGIRGPDGEQASWSRGTRIFQRRRGEWELVHQHLSYPYDPETGAAQTDRQP
ncbi:nuclear transport factor 2 family protein [Ruania sp. N2-46]|uniref:Nuclear transport factor 2 family protein n=1 Tax=Occultella gossypii TaxID=2800820 RepID=A0ABS7S9W8_9MICO|nr:nuclear transport factor 2 family protein [Occultella gossypii]